MTSKDQHLADLVALYHIILREKPSMTLAEFKEYHAEILDAIGAELDRDRVSEEQLREVIFAFVSDELSPVKSYENPVIQKLVIERGCGCDKIGNPMEGYDYTCNHEYVWDCEYCPIVTCEA
jgi:hypothetical protein